MAMDCCAQSSTAEALLHPQGLDMYSEIQHRSSIILSQPDFEVAMHLTRQLNRMCVCVPAAGLRLGLVAGCGAGCQHHPGCALSRFWVLDLAYIRTRGRHSAVSHLTLHLIRMCNIVPCTMQCTSHLTLQRGSQRRSSLTQGCCASLPRKVREAIAQTFWGGHKVNRGLCSKPKSGILLR